MSGPYGLASSGLIGEEARTAVTARAAHLGVLAAGAGRVPVGGGSDGRLRMRGMSKRLGVALAATLLVVSLAGCDWAMFGGGPAGTGATADTAVSVSTAASLAPAFSVPVQA